MSFCSRRTKMWGGLLMLIVHAFAPAMSASGEQFYTNDVHVCNKGGQEIWVAVAEEENLWLSPDNWRISGWKEVRPKNCVEVHSDYHSLEVKGRTPYFAFSQVGNDGNLGIVTYSPRESFFGDDHIKSRSKHFCVHPTDHFKYEVSGNGMSACRPPFVLAEFSIMVLGAYLRDSKITVNIDPSDAALVTPFNSPPSATLPPKEEAKSEPNLFTELFNAYKEEKPEERQQKRSAAQERPVDPPSPGWLGASTGLYIASDSPLLILFRFPTDFEGGVFVREIVENGPASKAGLMAGDMVSRIRYYSNDLKGMKEVPIQDANQLTQIAGSLKSGSIIFLKGYRANKALIWGVVLGAGPIH